MQYIGSNDGILTSINKNEPRLSLTVSYEIVLKAKKLENTQLYEIAFNDYREIQQIVQNKADHLDY